MSAPLLRALDLHHPNVVRDPGCLPALSLEPGLEAFLVVGEGSYLGVDYAVGDVLVCRGEARSGRPTVLVARHGRPRMGSVVGQRLLGDANEPCHPGRWQPVGELWALYRRSAVARGGWAVRSLHEASTAACGAPVRTGPPAPVGRVVRRRTAQQASQQDQLALFAA